MAITWTLCLMSLIWIHNSGLLDGACYSQESCLYDHLMTNYNSEVRPASGPSGTVQVNLAINFFSIIDLDEKNEVLKSVFAISSAWTDSFLSWNTSAYDVEEIVVNVKKLWLPDFAVTNSVESFYKTTFLEDFRAHIIYAGIVVWEFGGIFKTSCSLDLTKYPFDSQSCSLKIENWAYREDLVNLTGAEVDTSSYEENSLWTLTSTSVSRETYTETLQSYPRVTVTFNLKRKSKYYVFNILLPCLLVTLAALGVFWLPPDCGEKISLGITVLLAFSVFQIVIMDNTPVNSEATPFISEMVMTVMTMATVSVLTAMLTIFVHFKGSTHRVPKWLRFVAFRGIARVLFLRDEVNEVESSFEHGNTVKPLEQNLETEPIEMKPKPESELGAILKHLQMITDYLVEKKADDAVANEWKLLAKIIDRIFFCLAVFALFIAIVVIVPK